ncbi:acyl carrier protein [Amylibacter marinus]|uniref:Acyl carrier protein n=1 Tax=Amylibacter marinus TaxID=1475483 RepID=A0ABQ5VX21_9RHOB|nr:phosphopantetheine-binding protein [Amylibacter marinus]GLQ35971.1 acyl carrier protein [Amylibacter marinus]
MSEFFEELSEILELEDEIVTPEFAFGDKMDSLAVVSTIVLVDEQFNVLLDGNELVACKTVQDVLDLIKSKG